MGLSTLWQRIREFFCRKASASNQSLAEPRKPVGKPSPLADAGTEFFQDPAWERYDPGRPLLYQRMQEKEPMASHRYCGVIFYKADTVYHYRCSDPELRVGDRVLVPVHIRGTTQTAEGIVVSVGEYLADCVPHPLGQTSHVIRKL